MESSSATTDGSARERWPRAGDPAAAGRLAERFAALGQAEARLARSRRGALVLDALGGNSPYLAELALREPATLRAVLADGPDACVARAIDRLTTADAAQNRTTLATLLRRAKRQAALAIALADIAGIWPVDRVVAALTAFATAALCLCVDHLLADAARRGELRLADPARPSAGSGFVVLAMGKLGAGELNYSSDIDLVLIYDPEVQLRAFHGDGGSGAAAPVPELAACFSRIARGLVALMQQRDAEGYVFRTDLRLRPDPAATPPAVSLPAALVYYESLGQNWERAAMIKARPVAGDLDVGHGFLAAIRPFIWRRGLDFAAVADIGGMKRRIEAHRGLDRGRNGGGGDLVAAIAGFDLKLGRGGIRDIEFLAQTLQLVWGGRDPSLRVPTTLGALAALVRVGHLKRAAAVELADAYRLLRQLEHRVQMVADRQTHALPATADELDRFAVFFGLADAAALASLLGQALDRVRARHARVFEAVPDPGPGPDSGQRLDFAGPDAQPATLAQLLALGFANPQAIVAAVQGWQAGRVRALRSDRARLLLAEMLPALLAALARQPVPDAAFLRFQRFMEALPTGIQLLSLVQRNPALLDRIAAVLGAAPALSEYLARVPQALEGLVRPGGLPAPGRLLRARLAEVPADALEQAIGIIRATAHELNFQLSADTLERRIDADAAGLARSDLADGVIAALLPYVLADIARRFGTVRGGSVAIVALGKAGSREMLAGSDLDLMMVYDHPLEETESRIARGASGRAVALSHYYSRVAQGFIAALTAPGPEGPTYAVDMRLRPSGSAGPVAVSLAAFRRYHRDHAWTWERMAITRARVMAGPRMLSVRVADAIRHVIEQGGAPAALLRDAATMRARLARDLPAAGPWDVKHRTGGLMEVEFVAQVLQLVHAGSHPAVAEPTTRIALALLRDAGLIQPADAALLVDADHLWRTVQGMLRLTEGRAATAELPAASARALLAACGMAEDAGADALRQRMDDTGRAVREVFERLVGRPDPALLEKA